MANADEKERVELWEIRHEAAHIFMKQYPGMRHMATDVCVPLSELAPAIAHAEQLVERHGVRGAIIGHVGDGNFHVSLAVRPDDADDMAVAYKVNEGLVKYAISVGGACTGEHGVGLCKRKYQELEHGAAITVMRKIKAALDPDDLLNPGKLIDSDR